MPELLASLKFTDTLPQAPFQELHHRTVNRPIEDVWRECLDVEASEVRAIGPLFALRCLPARLRGRKPPQASAALPLLEVFTSQGFVLLRRDEHPVDGRAVVIFGAAGKFWSISHNAPIRFESPQAFMDFDEPANARTTARLEAIAQPDGSTRIETETWVIGTDKASTRKFAPYWAIIRLPSGLIRRSWLAAIERRAT